MSSRTGKALIAVLLVASAASLSADGWGQFVTASDRGDDSEILSFLKNADFQTSVDICQALGARADPYAADILSWLLAVCSTTSEYKTELLLRLAMASLFDESRGDQRLRARVEANAQVLDDMVNHIGRFRDPQLTGILVRLLPRLGSADRLRALMDVGAGLSDHLRQTRGMLSDPETALAFDYLEVVQEIGTQDFLPPCASVARLSRDKALVQRAREVAKLLAGKAH